MYVLEYETGKTGEIRILCADTKKECQKFIDHLNSSGDYIRTYTDDDGCWADITSLYNRDYLLYAITSESLFRSLNQ